MASLQKVPVAELANHATAKDCWVVVNGEVYDLTEFAPSHPGGPEMIWKYAGKDGSATYNAYHSATLIETTLSPREKKGRFDESTITETWLQAQREETTSSPDPNEKLPLSSIINLHDFERSFEKHGSEKAWAYIWNGSNDLLTLDANKSYWQKLWFRPRVMRNVARVRTKSTLLGADVSMPVFISPMGIAKTAGPEGETALGAGAAASGIVHCMSTTASLSIEDILASVPRTYPYFFQLYVDKQRAKTEAVLAKLEGIDNVRAIFVTVDLAVVSKREADERIRTAEKVSVYANSQAATVDKKGGGLARSTGSFIDWALSWEDVAWLRKHTTKPLVIKGIQSAADAKIAMSLGCAGIVVSNHGGRALDSAPATVLVLLELRRDCPAVFDKMEVFVDGGIRRGSDILKAVCLGARGVGVGRPFQCAVAYGKEGVETAGAILQDELETAMRLCGVVDLDSVRGRLEYLNTSELEQYLPPRPSWLSGSWLLGTKTRARL